MVGHSNLRDDVCALGKACVDEVLVFLQRLCDHLQLRVHVGHEEVFNPAVRQRQRLQLERNQAETTTEVTFQNADGITGT